MYLQDINMSEIFQVQQEGYFHSSWRYVVQKIESQKIYDSTVHGPWKVMLTSMLFIGARTITKILQ